MFKRASTALGLLCALTIASGPAMAADAAKGETIFKKRCVACHTIEEGKNKVGPSLFGVVGRKAGVAPKFKYSDSYVEAGQKGLVWTPDKIVPYLEDPHEYMVKAAGDPKAKTKMVFKLKPEDERQDVAAYLATVK
jgi:cytochrome c